MTTPGCSPFARKAAGFVNVTTSASEIEVGKSLPAVAKAVQKNYYFSFFSGKFDSIPCWKAGCSAARNSRPGRAGGVSLVRAGGVEVLGGVALLIVSLPAPGSVASAAFNRTRGCGGLGCGGGV